MKALFTGIFWQTQCIFKLYLFRRYLLKIQIQFCSCNAKQSGSFQTHCMWCEIFFNKLELWRELYLTRQEQHELYPVASHSWYESEEGWEHYFRRTQTHTTQRQSLATHTEQPQGGPHLQDCTLCSLAVCGTFLGNRTTMYLSSSNENINLLTAFQERNWKQRLSRKMRCVIQLKLMGARKCNCFEKQSGCFLWSLSDSDGTEGWA